MFKLKTATAALVFGFAVAAAATPALAKHRAASHPGYNARAEAIGGVGGPMEGRATVLRECNDQAGKFLEYTWGDFASYQRRACMAEHGQSE